MSAQFEIKGRCPGALSPMASADGLVVRVRPSAGVLQTHQALALADVAQRFGDGQVELTSRANVQLRGISEADHAAVVDALRAVKLVDPDARSETRRNIVVSPFGSGTVRTQALSVVRALERALAEIDGLPAKFGFAVDIGQERCLDGTSADVRIERDHVGRVLVRPDGLAQGFIIGGPDEQTSDVAQSVARQAVSLARWFLAAGGVQNGRGRMASFIATGAYPPGLHDVELAAKARLARPGSTPDGRLVAAEFGQLPGKTFAALSMACAELRMTPWRMLHLVGPVRKTGLPNCPSLIFAPDDARLRVTACSGAPSCSQGFADTRSLARQLAPSVPADEHLHVSGCSKGCARQAPAATTLVADEAGFKIVKDGNARSRPKKSAVQTDALLSDPELIFSDR
ncbi:MAG: precorrin-3B synthase [Pseudomonadota bacterium]